MSAQMALDEFESAGRDLSTLTDRQREVYELVEQDGLAPHEAADGLDVRPTTVRTQLHRARSKLGEQRRVGT
jgi:DNA-directed RNA polymerase specialized sigma24 family protein